MATDEDLTRRARVAYYQAGGVTHPKTIHVREFDGLRYVVVATNDTVLAVYRVRADEFLRRLRRPPRPLRVVTDGPADTRTGQEN